MMRATLLLFAALLLPAPLAGAELTGYISDAACGWNNAREGKEARECARVCVKEGWPPVFVLDGGMKVYKIADRSAVMPFVGAHVAIHGEIAGDAVRIRSIREAPPNKAPRK